uniref:non-specific serine/threonine protein kinase n=1 Tax=Leersia perrieri TaxID=77586 RepID=A0A0D9V0B2_9ORYZ
MEAPSSSPSLKDHLSSPTGPLHLKVWEVICIVLGAFMVVVFFVTVWLTIRSRKKTRRASANIPITQIPAISKEIKEVRVEQVPTNEFVAHDGVLLTIQDKSSDKESDKVMVHLGVSKSKRGDESHSGSFRYMDKDAGFQSADEGGSGTFRHNSAHAITAPSPLVGLPEFSYLGWGHWFTLRDLEVATSRFSKDNILGEGGYGVVYRGQLINGTPVAVKKLLNNLGQAEKEFRVEVEAIGHVRHKNLVRLLGYCVEGTQSYVAPEYANTGLLNEKSDIYSFGVVLLEAITGRDPVDYARPANEVNLVDWLKMMVASRRSEEVVDPTIETRPSTRALKRALLTALRCVDPDSEKRPKMGQVVRMLESDDPIPRGDRRSKHNRGGSTEMDSQRDNNSDTDKSDNPDSKPSRSRASSSSK